MIIAQAVGAPLPAVRPAHPRSLPSTGETAPGVAHFSRRRGGALDAPGGTV